MTTFASQINAFNGGLEIASPLPADVGVMNPFTNPTTRATSEEFYHKYYNDDNTRHLILGINPGRFGAGLTGIPFTDPIRLEDVCHISHAFARKPELSSQFIYMVIDAFGGVEKFFNEFYISSISPLGFVKDGKNLNYYDLPALKRGVEAFVIETLNTQLTWPIHRTKVYCLGEGANYKYLKKLNEKHQFFESITPLAHPRYIMQYKRKRLDEYIKQYVDQLKNR